MPFRSHLSARISQRLSKESRFPATTSIRMPIWRPHTRPATSPAKNGHVSGNISGHVSGKKRQQFRQQFRHLYAAQYSRRPIHARYQCCVVTTGNISGKNGKPFRQHFGNTARLIANCCVELPIAGTLKKSSVTPDTPLHSTAPATIPAKKRQQFRQYRPFANPRALPFSDRASRRHPTNPSGNNFGNNSGNIARNLTITRPVSLTLLRPEKITTRAAISRAEEHPRRYVRQTIREHAAGVWSLLTQGAAIYVGGDASRMAPEVCAPQSPPSTSNRPASAPPNDAWLTSLTAPNRSLVDT